jgi:hypothetical protein
VKATFIPDVVTPLDPRDVLSAFRQAFEDVTNTKPSKDAIALLMAQSALETGRWKAIHCFNLGNVKAATDYVGFYTMFRCNEVINGKTVWFNTPHAQTRFRAFVSLWDGARDHLEFLAMRPRYAAAWKELLRGDVDAYVHALKTAGYFTANEESYREAVSSLFREYQRLIDAQPAEPAPVPPEKPQPLAGPVSVAESVVSDALRELRDTDPAPPPSGAVS